MKKYTKPEIVVVDIEASSVMSGSIPTTDEPVGGDAERISRSRSEWDNVWER